MSYNHMNYTPVSGNYPLPYTVPSLQNHQGTTLMKKHKCRFCNYASERAYDVKKHESRKHGGMNITNVQGCGMPVEIENAGVVYQQNYPQLPLTSPATYNQFNIPPPQQLSYQTAYLGGYDQHPMQPQIKCSMSHGQIHGESNGAFQHGSSLQSNIPLNANVETQSEVESDEGEPDILELLKDTTINFLDIQFIKKEFGATLRRFKKFGNRKKMEKFIRTYANLKVRVMDEYDELDKGEKDETDESVDIDSDGEGSEDMDVQGSDDGGGDIDDEGSESESEGDSDETSDGESLDTEEKKTHEKDGDVKSKEGGEDDLVRERFYDFIFEVEEFFDEEDMKKLKKYEEEAREELKREKLKSLGGSVNLLNIKHKGKDKLLHMKFCSDECIHAISECCDKIIDNKFGFNQKQLSKIKRKFKPITRDLRRLVRQSTSIQRKRKILQKPQVGNGVLGIIASLAVPALMKLFVK